MRGAACPSAFCARAMALLAAALILCGGFSRTAAAQSCGSPGKDGSGTISGTVNTYYPGSASVAAGGYSITLGSSGGASTPISIGDMVLVMQMQNATINSADTSSYGSGSGSGQGITGGTAGAYEFAIAASAVSTAGGTLMLTKGLINSYYAAAASGTQGQQIFQVIRVPQYASPTLGAVTALAWNGSIGGVVAMDVQSTLALGAGTITASALGFRGAGGYDAAGNAAYTNTEYRIPSEAGTGGSKGEGIAGTPRLVASSATTILDNGADGYPNGDFDRGAPGNAGGGGTDSDPTANDENSGGGGGGNGGAGGQGGFSWNAAANVGGVGGAAFGASVTAVVMGGGAGSGTMNNNAATPYVGNGGAGGGIVIIRTNAVSGTGTINANGQTAPNNPAQDGAPGGGAGGSVVVATKTGTLAGLTVNATGGAGANAWPTSAPGGTYTCSLGTNACYANEHGPGGGGGGGVILSTGGLTATSVAGGAHGTTDTNTQQFGSANGSAGTVGAITFAAIPGAFSGAQCASTSAGRVSGNVYVDSNHNGSQDSGENWISGSSVYVNLISGGTVSQSIQLPAGPGSFNFMNVAAGTYTLVVTNSASSTSAVSPAGYLPVDPTTPTQGFTVGTDPVVNRNFGFFQGTKLSGEVFLDNGAGTGGVANNGVLDGSEPGIANVTLTATGTGSVLLDTEVTGAAGVYTIWIPSTAVDPVKVVLSNLPPYSFTGVSAGTPATGGSFTASSLTYSFSPTLTSAGYTGVNFGFVPGTSFAPNGSQATMPGAFALYPHVFISPTGGTVVFTETLAQNQPNYFGESLYQDPTCSGNLAKATYLAWGAAVTVPAGGGKVCILMKENVSLQASFDQQNAVTITATFVYTGSSLSNATLTVLDATTVGSRSSGELQLVKSVYIDASCANPASPVYVTTATAAVSGNCIKYQIQATNDGAAAISGLTLNDVAPPFTTYQAGTASESLGSSCTGLVAGSITVSSGTISAPFTGSMPPTCVATLVYEVKVN